MTLEPVGKTTERRSRVSGTLPLVLLVASGVVGVRGIFGDHPATALLFSCGLALMGLRWRLFVSRLGEGDAIALCLPVIFWYNALSIVAADTETRNFQTALLFLACFAFCIGAGTSRRQEQTSLLSSARSLDIGGGPKPLLFLIFLVGAAFAVMNFAQGGIPALSDSVGEARLETFSNGYLATVTVTCLQASLIFCTCVLFQPSPLVRRGSFSHYVAMSAASFLLLFGFGSRGLYFVPALVIIVYLLFCHTAKLARVIVAGVAIIGIISYLGYQRDLALYGDSYNQDIVNSGVPRELLFLGPVVSYFRGSSETLERIIYLFPDRVDHPFGAVFFSPLISPLPGEQPTAGQFLKSSLNLDFIGFGLAPGSIGGFYMDFGILGVLLGFLILGRLARTLESAARRNPTHTLTYAFFVAHMWFMNYSHPLPYLAVLTTPFLLYVLARDARIATGTRRSIGVRGSESSS